MDMGKVYNIFHILIFIPYGILFKVNFNHSNNKFVVINVPLMFLKYMFHRIQPCHAIMSFL